MVSPSRALTGLLLATAACGGGSITGPDPLLTQLPRDLSAAELRLIDAGNQFTFDLFRTATGDLSPAGNAFLSPLSASMALGMALNGAGGETFDAMRTSLGYGETQIADINRGYRDLIQLLMSLDRKTEMIVANSVWSALGFPILPSFVDAARTWFDAEARSLPFDQTAVDAINGWVNDRTRTRIPRLLEAIQPDEVAFLINAIYFKGLWRKQFDPDRTRDQPFRAADGTTQSVPTMSLEPTELHHAATADYEAVDLLYGNGAFAMTVILPREGRTPAQVLAQMDAQAWRTLTDSFAEHRLGLALPKLRMEYERTLNDDLKALGMEVAFDQGRADFYGIADVRPERLYLSRVIQKTFVEVNEEGTEAAAATAVGVGVTSAPPFFTVDRPFLFMIRERLSGTILFVGQINRVP